MLCSMRHRYPGFVVCFCLDILRLSRDVPMSRFLSWQKTFHCGVPKCHRWNVSVPVKLALLFRRPQTISILQNDDIPHNVFTACIKKWCNCMIVCIHMFISHCFILMCMLYCITGDKSLRSQNTKWLGFISEKQCLGLVFLVTCSWCWNISVLSRSRHWRSQISVSSEKVLRHRHPCKTEQQFVLMSCWLIMASYIRLQGLYMPVWAQAYRDPAKQKWLTN